LYPENKLRILLVQNVIDVIKKVEESEEDQINERELAILSKRVSGVDHNIKLTGKVIIFGCQLLTKVNIWQLRQFERDPKELKRPNQFINNLP